MVVVVESGRRTFYFSYNKQNSSAAIISTMTFLVFNVTCHLKYKNAHFMLSAAPHEIHTNLCVVSGSQVTKLFTPFIINFCLK